MLGLTLPPPADGPPAAAALSAAQPGVVRDDRRELCGSDGIHGRVVLCGRWRRLVVAAGARGGSGGWRQRGGGVGRTPWHGHAFVARRSRWRLQPAAWRRAPPPQERCRRGRRRPREQRRRECACGCCWRRTRGRRRRSGICERRRKRAAICARARLGGACSRGSCRRLVFAVLWCISWWEAPTSSCCCRRRWGQGRGGRRRRRGW